MLPVHLEMNLFLELALRAFDYTTDFKNPPPDFKDDVVLNKRKLPPPQIMVEEDQDQDQDELSDVDISSDISDDEQ